MNLLKRPGILVWFVLMLATVVTTWVLSKDIVAARTGTVAIIAIAFYKVRLVLLHFMELRHAPRGLRLFFELWVLVVAAAMIGMYLSGSAAPA
ncbi:cytochrome c oxidase subunit IV [Panacagrimonas perspica]|uniref:Cytochrome c oxidase subunit IV n=1 Tax=Panacagrimonas perspica TaxID=381431 RepID=A0A4S3K664_9GAMM|nr:cytochrome C oxidase subunit IV family protein [Panacagrimonas perspica]TDU26880.1 cytochrome c oxidase subunit IV [Panacagrimonas perspica]THD03647.1 hypothetical protein B1810_08880 [Panacagrimonas perspica]